MRPGPSNSLTDVTGLRVGHHTRRDPGWLTGMTVVLAPEGGAVAGVDVRGGGPGTRETDLLDPRNLVDRVHAVVLTGGSAFGLAAADGVMTSLFDRGVGFPVGGPGEVVPIVPAAVLFDLGRGGDFTRRPDASFGSAAVDDATDGPVSAGVVGAGTGATAGPLKGGVGSASQIVDETDGADAGAPFTVAALVVTNAAGSPFDPETGRLHSAALLSEADCPGGVRPGQPSATELADARAYLDAHRSPLRPGTATTIGVVATDARLTKAQCQKLAGVAHDGLARAANPIHTMVDGDTLFALATGTAGEPGLPALYALHAAAADCVTRAFGRAILAAETVTTGAGTWRSYRDLFPSALGPG